MSEDEVNRGYALVDSLGLLWNGVCNGSTNPPAASANTSQMCYTLRSSRNTYSVFVKHAALSKEKETPETVKELQQMDQATVRQFAKTVVTVIDQGQVLISSGAEKYILDICSFISRAEGDITAANDASPDTNGHSFPSNVVAEICVMCNERITFEDYRWARCSRNHQFSKSPFETLMPMS